MGGEHSEFLSAPQQPATVLHYDGKAWTKKSSPSVGPLLGVTGSGKSYHAVGAAGGKIWHFDGAAWTSVADIATAGWLAGIATCSSNKLAVVGSTHTGMLTSKFKGYGVVALYDTTTKGWTSVTVTGVTHLLDVWCDAGGTIVAVGGVLIGPEDHTNYVPYSLVEPKIVSCTSGGVSLICKVVDPPTKSRYHAGRERGGLLDIWGASKSDLYAVGEAGALLHFDGKSWDRAPVDIRAAGHNWGCEDLLGIWGTSKDLFVTTRSGVLRLGKLP